MWTDIFARSSTQPSAFLSSPKPETYTLIYYGPRQKGLLDTCNDRAFRAAYIPLFPVISAQTLTHHQGRRVKLSGVGRNSAAKRLNEEPLGDDVVQCSGSKESIKAMKTGASKSHGFWFVLYWIAGSYISSWATAEVPFTHDQQAWVEEVLKPEIRSLLATNPSSANQAKYRKSLVETVMQKQTGVPAFWDEDYMQTNSNRKDRLDVSQLEHPI